MPRNGSGQYNPLTNTWNPPVTGVLATGADFQAQLNDISAAITQSVSKDGQTPMTANLPMGNNSIVGIASGTETSPSISANGDTNTGLYFPAADTVAIATGGVKRVEVDANGNVGVGVTPSAWGTNYKAIESAGNSGFTIAAANVNGINLVSNAYATNAGWFYKTTGPASYYNPGASGVHQWFTALSGTAGNAIAFTQAMSLDASGNLGIGATSPAARIDVRGPSNQTVQVWTQLGSIGNYAELALKAYNSFSGTSSAYIRAVSTASGNSGTALTFATEDNGFGGAVERARITSDGNLLVGVSSGTGHNFWKSAPSSYTAWFYNTGTTAGTRVLDLTMSTNGDATGRFIDCGDAGAFRMRVLGNGNLQNFNNSYGAISDAKLKENITDATPKLGKINQVRIVNFNMIGDTQKQIGVIAQELEQVFPSMIEEMPDRDDEGNDLGTVTKSVKYSVFVPILIKAIQEQQALIDAQKTAIESLTARIAALEAK